MDLRPYLETMIERRASDLFFSAGAPTGIKIEGKTEYLDEQKLSGEAVKRLVYSILTQSQVDEFERELELNLAHAEDGVGRFRINVYRQRGSLAMVVRHVKDWIPSIEELNLPLVLKDLVMEPRGLVLVVGPTGCGKSTTLASMVDYRSANKSGHILTVEEPIEFLHKHKKSIVDQREVGLDTHTYAQALKNAMREAPDVILIGEIRDRETMQHAIAYAETGHLCLSTLHSNNADQALDRIMNFFPDTAHRQLFVDLSLHLRGIVSQRLIPGVDGKRIPAVELLLHTPYVADLILREEIAELKEAIKKGGQHGMQSFDQALFKLFATGKVTAEEALAHADSRNDLGLAIRQSAGQLGVPERWAIDPGGD